MAFIVKSWVHITLHVIKQIQIIHKLMKRIASTTLQNGNKMTSIYHELGAQFNKDQQRYDMDV